MWSVFNAMTPFRVLWPALRRERPALLTAVACAAAAQAIAVPLPLIARWIVNVVTSAAGDTTRWMIESAMKLNFHYWF